MLDELAGLAAVPFVGGADALGEIVIGPFGEVDFGRFGFAITNAVDAAAGAVYAVIVMAFADIRPVEHVYGTVGRVAELDAAEPFVGGGHEIRCMFAHVSGALPME